MLATQARRGVWALELYLAACMCCKFLNCAPKLPCPSELLLLLFALQNALCPSFSAQMLFAIRGHLSSLLLL